MERTDKKLTDAEVKKALECCGEYSDCPHICPLRDMAYVGDCIQVKAKAALDLINRLEGENEKNENIIRFADKTIATLNAENESLKAEVERLKETIEVLRPVVEQSHIIRKGGKSPLSLIKAEAYKEFAERLKDESEHFELEKENFVSENQIDNLLNELVGDLNGKDG